MVEKADGDEMKRWRSRKTGRRMTGKRMSRKRWKRLTRRKRIINMRRSKGARRQVQGMNLHPHGFYFSILLQSTIHTQSLTPRRHQSLSTERNTTAGFGVPQVDTRQMFSSTLC